MQRKFCQLSVFVQVKNLRLLIKYTNWFKWRSIYFGKLANSQKMVNSRQLSIEKKLPFEAEFVQSCFYLINFALFDSYLSTTLKVILDYWSGTEVAFSDFKLLPCKMSSTLMKNRFIIFKDTYRKIRICSIHRLYARFFSSTDIYKP